MSDSEEDVSCDSLSDEEVEEIEEVEIPEDIEIETANTDEAEAEDIVDVVEKKNNPYFQKEIWLLKKLPYYSELEAEANMTFKQIKKGLIDSILLNDTKVGFKHWTVELDKYIYYYGKRFSKQEHIQLINCFLPLVKPGNIYRSTENAMRILVVLLRKGFLLREDITIDWKPLHDLYIEVVFQKLEADGVFFIPDNFLNVLENLITHARNYFSEESVQEILDECRPYMCVWDESCIRTWKVMEMFLCMNMPMEKQKYYGTALWFEEVWYWFEKIDNNSLFSNNIIKMFNRISSECPGLIDWSSKLDLIFTKILRSLRLGQITGLCQSFSIENGTQWVSYMLGTSYHDEVLHHLKHLFNQIETFLHPSNNGIHTKYVILFIAKLMTHIFARVRRERNEAASHKPKTNPLIPPHMRMTQEKIDNLVELFVPLLKLITFTKTNKDLSSPLFRAASHLSPKVVLPVVLDLIYPALETLVEPHRLIQAMSVLVAVLVPLCKDEPGPDGKTYRIHAITILNSLVPGLDTNDIRKCMSTYQIIGVIVNLVALVDCSDAVHNRCDLTEDERELCSATANFESIVSIIMDRMIEMIIACGHAVNTTCANSAMTIKVGNSIEETVLYRGSLSLFKGICKNSSSEIYKVVLNKLYNFVCEHMFDNKIVNDVVADMVNMACKYHPEIAFSKFLTLVLQKLQSFITPEFYTEEKSDFTILWWLNIASRVVRVPPQCLINHWDQIRELLDLLMPFKRCTLATEKVLVLYSTILEQMTSMHVMSQYACRPEYDLPTDQFLAIRHWAAPIDKKTWNPKWFLPTEETIDKAIELLEAYFVRNIAALNTPEQFDKKEILLRLGVVRASISGCCFSLPSFEGEVLDLWGSQAFKQTNVASMVIKPKGTPEISLNGKNVRQIALDCVMNLLNYLFEYSSDDYRSIQEILKILRILPMSRGILKEDLKKSMDAYKMTKLMLGDRMIGNKATIQMLMDEYLNILHKKRVSAVEGWHFKKQNIDILKTLLKVATSTYTVNRSKAQVILLEKLQEYPMSYKLVIDDILKFLDPELNAPHQQLKGALYLLVIGKKQSLCMKMDFEQQAKIWPALVNTKYTEKPSVIKLLDSAQNIIGQSYETYQINFEFDERCVDAAYKLLTAAEEGSPLHDPNCIKLPPDDMIEKYKCYSQQLYEDNKKWYYTLLDRLYSTASNPNLHWRPVEMSLSMLSMLMRKDIPMPDNIIKVFCKLMIHDTLKIRKIATSFMSACIKKMKPKAVKRELKIPYMEPNTGPGAKFPINNGFRTDNRIMMYEEDKLPTTDEEWNNFQFCGKQYWGVYTWPKKLITYAPLNEQTAIDREYDDLKEIEKFIVDCFRDREYMKRFIELFSVGTKKDNDSFSSVNFSLFQCLFRVFNDTLCSAFQRPLETLLTSSRLNDNKLGAEIFTGMVNGAKLWRYEKQRKMWSWLGPILTKAFETMQEDSMKNYGTALATICGCSEARMLKPLIDLLFKLIERPTENALAANSRIYLMQSALSQFQWRGVELWNRLMNVLEDSYTSQYANLRERLAVILVCATWYDTPAIYVSPELPARLQPPKVDYVIQKYNELMNNCWDEVRIKMEEGSIVSNGSIGCLTASASNASLLEMSEVKKSSRIALKTAVSYVFNAWYQSYVSLQNSVIKFFPLFCHYANDVGDEELQKIVSAINGAHGFAIYVSPENAKDVINVFSQILTSSCWWRSKMVALKFIRMLVFANSFVFSNYREEIGHLLIYSLNDSQFEVRQRAHDALAILLQSKFFELTPSLVEKFNKSSLSDNQIEAHGGVLGLAAIVLAYPYSVPEFLPDVLMKICRFASSKNATIRETVKKTLSDFKRTHQDSWREHKNQFNENQLLVLRDLLISPNYYV